MVGYDDAWYAEKAAQTIDGIDCSPGEYAIAAAIIHGFCILSESVNRLTKVRREEDSIGLSIDLLREALEGMVFHVRHSPAPPPTNEDS